MDPVKLPNLFIDSPFPQKELFTPTNKFRPHAEFFEKGRPTNISNKYAMSAGIVRDWILAPLGAICTPFVLVAILIHYLVYIIFIKTVSFKSFFATHFVIGSAHLNKKVAEKYREQLESLTWPDKELFENIETDQKKQINKHFENSVECHLRKSAPANDLLIGQTESPEQLDGKKNESLEHIGLCQKILSNVRKSSSLHFETIKMENCDSKLDGFSVRPYSQQKKPPEEQKWIIYYPGRATCWETCHNSVIELSNMTGANVLAFNYRGVLRSGREDLNDPKSPQQVSTSPKMLKEDAAAAVKHITDMGFKKDQILNYGYSLGGGVASTQTDMAICSDRSFRSLSKAAEAFFWAPLIRQIMAFLTVICFGALNAYKNVRQIQKNGKHVYICTSKQDAIIDIRKASLYSGFRDKSPENVPPTLFLTYDDSGKKLMNRIYKRFTAHSADIHDTLPRLIQGWLSHNPFKVTL